MTHARRIVTAGLVLALATPCTLSLAPTIAMASPQDDLAAASAKLDSLGTALSSLQEQLSSATSELEQTGYEIANTEQQISDTQTQLDEKRQELGTRMKSSYKSGPSNALDLILSSASFEELSSNIYYLDKITDNDRRLIEDVERLKGELEEHQAELEIDRAELEDLRSQQVDKLNEMQNKQQEVQTLLDDLDDDVKELIAKRDEELLQLAREREEQQRREEEARKAAEAASSGGSGAHAGGVSGSYNDGGTSGSQARVIAACHSTGSPGAGLCAMWVSMVFSNAGFAYAGGNANDMYNAWTTSSNRADLKPGMIVAVSTHSHTSAGRIYGHIGIYIGGGTMMDNIGYIRTISVNEWVNYYSTTVTPRWGWLMGIKLS